MTNDKYSITNWKLGFENWKFKAQAFLGAVAQLGERVLCKHEVGGSIPLCSTKIFRQEKFSWMPRRALSA